MSIGEKRWMHLRRLTVLNIEKTDLGQGFWTRTVANLEAEVRKHKKYEAGLSLYK